MPPTIHKLEDNVATYKAIADKAKERLEEVREAANKREAALRKTIEEQAAQLREVDAKISFQDIATTKIAALNKELVEMQARSSKFLQTYEDAENERIRLFDELQEHKINSLQ